MTSSTGTSPATAGRFRSTWRRRASRCRRRCRSGRPRSTPARRARQGKNASVVQQQPGRIVFRTTRPLPPRNGLTVAAAWQKGVVEPPTAAQQARYWLEDNRGLVIAVAGLAFLLVYYAFAWLRVGRDPPIGTIIPLFGPPDGMSPAATRYVDRMSFDNRMLHRRHHQSRRARSSADRRGRREDHAQEASRRTSPWRPRKRR